MKKLYFLLLSISLTLSAWAQAPEKMSYQAVIRGTDNILCTNQNVNMQIGILQGSSSGDLLYLENHTPTTNKNGLVSIEIGAGSLVSGSFTDIDWSKGPYFILTMTYPTGGTNYSITGTSQLLSVPYALHAATAEQLTGGQLDSAGITTMGYVAGPKTIDTKLDETAVDAFVANNGYLTQEKDSSVTNEIELPTGGNSGQILSADGSGTYSWIDAGAGGLVADAINDGTTGVAPSQNAVFDGLALKASIADAIFTGTPTAPTAASGTNTTQIATTAFVQSAAASDINGLSDALVESGSIYIGSDPSSTTDDASSNTSLGGTALDAITTGDFNVAIGSRALSANTTGSRNVVSGHDAGDLITTGSNNVILGNSADPSANNATNQIVIGYNATGTGDNEITLGNSSITTLRAQVTSITSLSDKRDKTEIVSLTEGLDFIKQLKPVSFTWDTRDKAKVGIKSAGFIAQDLLALQQASLIGENLDLVSEVNPEKLEARYANLLPVIVKAIQEESAMKDKEIADLKESVRLLQEQMKKLINQSKE